MERASLSSRIASAFLALMVLSACVNSPAPDSAVTQATPIEVPPYRLATSDKLRVTIFGEESLSGEFMISDSGTVALPLIGEVPAAGATIAEVQNNIAVAARNYVREPKVAVEVLNYRPYYILGEVNRPGQYPYSTDITVLNAVAAAEGFTYRANMRRVFIKHANLVGEQEYPLTASIVVQPGDTIRITERYF